MINRRGRISLFVQHQIDVFHENFNLSLTTCDIEAIHDMRVAVKKLRASYLLLAELDKDKYLEKELTAIKPLYRASGKLRDLQLKEALLTKNFRSRRHDYIHAFILRLKHHHNQVFIEQARNCQSEYLSDFAALSRSLLLACPEAEFNHIIQKRISSHIHTARMYVANAVSIRDLHLARRYTKQVYHIMMMSGIVSWSDLQARFTRRNLKSVEESIGNWHDHVQLKLWLETLKGGIDFPTYKDLHSHFDVKSARMHQSAIARFNRIAGHYH